MTSKCGLLGLACLGTLATCLLACHTALAVDSPSKSPAGWDLMEVILRRIVPPAFPDRNFPITDYGAVSDGKTDSKQAFDRAIRACSSAGGGKVVVEGGTFLCEGPIHLANNVNLHVKQGATIKFGADPAKYLPAVLTRFEGTLLMGHSPRIYVRGATNIAITGKGIIDGSGRATLDFMKAKPRGGSGTLRKMGAEGVPVQERVFAKDKWMRPSMIQPFECKNILIEDVTLLDSCFWVVHPVLCQNVTVRGIRVESMNPNNDGCDPDSSSDVLIENCVFETGDDSIAIKSGRDQDGWSVGRPSENIVIRNVLMGSRHSGLCIGSEMSGGVRNVFMEDCKLGSVSSALYFKANLDRGGLVENVWARRVHADKVRDGLVRFHTTYQGYRGGNYPPVFRNYVMEDISARESASYGFNFEGAQAAPVRHVTLRRAKVENARQVMRMTNALDIVFENVFVNGGAISVPSSAAPASEPSETSPLNK